jgi:hypothetical protein
VPPRHHHSNNSYHPDPLVLVVGAAPQRCRRCHLSTKAAARRLKSLPRT